MRMSELHAEQSDEVAALWDEIRRMEARLRATVTPRDQFAMAALATIGAMISDDMAECAYEIADAMMEARDAKG